MSSVFRPFLGAVFVAIVGSLGFVGNVIAASAEEINIEVDAALSSFKEEIKGGKEFLEKAEGVLVFPKITKGGFIVGGEYGEGALRVGDETVNYYSIASASFGFQAGAQQYGLVMVFLKKESMEKFQASKGWEAGVDGSVAIAKWGAGTDINTKTFKDPIVGFVISNKGLMAGVSVEGSKITKLEK